LFGTASQSTKRQDILEIWKGMAPLATPMDGRQRNEQIDTYLAKPDLLKGRDVNSAVCFVKCFSMQVGTLNTRRGLTTLDGAWGKNQV